MDLDNYKSLWTTEKKNYVLLKTDVGGYFVCHRATNTLLLTEDEDLHEAIINEMLKNQCEVEDY